MWLELTPELQVFSDEMRDWISANAPAGLDQLADWSTPWGAMGRYQLVEEARRHPLHAAWEERLLGARLICPHWPEEVGGRGWDAVRLAVFDLACHQAGVPRIERGMGESLVGPSLLGAGTPEQAARFLPRIISGEDVYCQGFSEPDHGSDLAAVETKGVVDGDEIVITGQKVWTSGAHAANMIFVLCRTDPAAPKHRGLSFVLAPFSADNGIEVRRIPMLNGTEEFCEDFFDGARAPLANVIGGLNNGWHVAMTALAYERGAEATTQHLSYLPEFWDLVGQARKAGRIGDQLVRQRLATAYLNVELMRYGGLRTLARLIRGLPPGALEAVGKLHWSEYHRWLGEVAIELDDTAGLVRPEGAGYPTTRWQDLWLSSRSGTIYSGTSEIQRNIVAERILGLPKEPAAGGGAPRRPAAGTAVPQAAPPAPEESSALPGFVPSAEQRAFAGGLRRFLHERAPVSTARALMTGPDGFDPGCWRQLAGQLGLQGLRIPEHLGGSGQGWTELRIALTELGRELYPGPFLASAVLATEAILASGDPAAMADLLPGLAAGDTIGALALPDGAGPRAEPGGGRWALDGGYPVVLHGQAATLLVVAAATAGGSSLFAVDPAAAGVAVTPLPALDQTRQLARIELSGAPGRLIGAEGAAGPVIAAVQDRAALALAADSLGVAERALELTVAYARTRQQFGRPIGSFQAVKHKCADMLKSVELARSGLYYAAHAADAEPAELTAAAAIAKIQCCEAAALVTGESIQIHGGIGFTWEHDAHLYFKRARASAALLGDLTFHRERLLQAIGV
ncbi:MAG TPA: acyl-CoA dehydrogenase family protein [Streptosporangiaceae bacterium]|nr:acyl-CoA dehydrogenase family protein [Streptosporangiaceae bacterium]